MNSKNRTLMVQGTTSDAGKSTLVAGLCRVLARRGVKVAPFKPQNMALNSAVTVSGGEIGRAQAVQAQAAFIEPTVDMNPVLLKPSSDTGAQVIIHGKALANMNARTYHDYKQQAWLAVAESHQRLLAQYDCVLVEGAGSPAEINLRDRDIANMGFAERVDCPVIIIADIDKGGVFAHLVGTLELLSESERQRVVGFVINRFRGDIALLQPGIDWLEQYTGKPVLATLPYLHGLYLEAEDAVAIEQQSEGAVLNVLVPVLPHISNHTDFDVLRLHPQVNVQMIGTRDLESALPAADLIILPGSKSVASDLAWLKAQGWEDHIKRHLRYGGKVMGICGGYQMLGEQILDPQCIESETTEIAGLGLLSFNTTLQANKHLERRQGVLVLNGREVAATGYEIHCGESQGDALQQPLIRFSEGERTCYEGVISDEQNMLGTYWHGIFDHPEACQALLQWAGIKAVQPFDAAALRERNIDRLADSIEAQFDEAFLSDFLQNI